MQVGIKLLERRLLLHLKYFKRLLWELKRPFKNTEPSTGWKQNIKPFFKFIILGFLMSNLPSTLHSSISHDHICSGKHATCSLAD